MNGKKEIGEGKWKMSVLVSLMLVRIFPLSQQDKYDQILQLTRSPGKSKARMKDIKNENRLAWKCHDVRINLNFTSSKLILGRV